MHNFKALNRKIFNKSKELENCKNIIQKLKQFLFYILQKSVIRYLKINF